MSTAAHADDHAMKGHGDRMRLFRILYGSAGLGLATTIVVMLLLLALVGAKRTGEIIFGYSIAFFIVGFGALWFPFVKKHMK